jgi:non-ribosomal peptide synthase protein (TIGR01720 family)
MQDATQPVQQNELEGIAVVGMSGRFPGAATLQQFWQNLCDGVESITFFSESELRAAGVEPELPAHPNYVPARGMLEDADQFDAAFFGYSPREAELLDPQHRLFLECAWEALECAGYDPEHYAGIIGVVGSVSLSTYAMRNIYANRDLIAIIGDYQALLSSDKDFIAERVSYKLNLRGPSLTVQTACSSSLVAVHMACRSLLMGESDMVLAGGASISVPQRAGYLYQEGSIMSPDGHCRAFDARAQGTVRGEGAGIVVLKRLEDALAEGDTVYAVIRGSAITNDGAFKVGFTAPSIDGQAEAIGLALAMADVDPDTISYVEAHGTGTPLGDPIEIAALTQVFREYTQRNQYCAIGSVKTNLGHLDAAAGITGLLKAVLALHHRTLPPSLHFTQPNPTIDFANTPFVVQQAPASWESGHHPRRAGVSSFGIGGTNAHAVLEEAPAPPPTGSARPWQVLPLSARSAAALEQATANLAHYLQQQPAPAIADVAYTLQTGRRAFPHRRVLVCRDRADLLTALETQAANRQWTAHCDTQQRPVAFLFPGQGAQYVQMGAELYQYEPLVRDIVDTCANQLRPLLDHDLRDLLFPPPERSDAAAQLLAQTQYTQPALFVIEYALARLWQAWGVTPSAMLGHSLGEYVAACLAGVLTLPDALDLVARRGNLMQALEPGAMLAVPLAEAQIQPFLNEQVALAAVNAPELCVLSGPFAAIDAVEARLQQADIDARRLHTSHAFHSAMMEPMPAAFRDAVARVSPAVPQIPYLSNVTGTWITPEEATDPDYWVQHVRAGVRFGPGAATLLAQEEFVLLEVGPGRTLSSLVRKQGAAARSRPILTSLRHPQDAAADGLNGDMALLTQTLGRLWLAGVAVDWDGVAQYGARRRVSLPTYPFERQRYWIDPPANDMPVAAPVRTLDKQPDITNWFYTPVWHQSGPISLSSSVAQAAAPQCRLLLASATPLVDQLREQGNALGHNLICVYPADHFAQLDEQTYTINPCQPNDYVTLLAALRERDRQPQKVIHCWNVPAEHAAATNGAFHPPVQDTGFYSLLFLAQALAQTGRQDRLHIAVLTTQLHEITGNEQVRPEGALLQGLCTVIPQEYPHLTCTNIDIVPPVPGSHRYRQFMHALLAELDSESTDTLVAYRGTQRWLQTFAPLPLHRTGSTRLRDGGVYLILGGLGGIGLTLAEHLARTRQARLALVGRSALPARDAWADWSAEHDAQDATSQKIQAVQALEALGSEVLLLSADIADLEQMQEVVAQVCRRFGTLHGVIHAAGITGERSFEMLQEADRAACEAQLHAKVTGLYVLEQVLDSYPLDFCLLVSSLASVLGGRGLAAYTAAGRFMDAFTRSHNQRHPVPWLSVNWDNWRVLAESATEPPAAVGGFAELARLAMTKQEGLEVVERVLATDTLTQVITSTADLPTRIAHLAARDQEKQQRRRPTGASPLHARPELPTSYAPPTSVAEQKLVTIWQDLLGITPIGIADNFFELGGDSLISIQVIARAREADLEFTPKQVFEYPTIADLAAMAGTAQAVQANQEPVTGAVPLTPVQHWFFAQDIPERHHWNQAMLFAVAQPLDIALLREVLQQFLRHHDALRLRFVYEPDGWRQFYAEPATDEAVDLVEHVDMSTLPAPERAAAIQAIAAERQSSLNLAEGPLLRLIYFDGDTQPGRLLFILHHLIVDAVSWRILLEDFQAAYQQRRQGAALTLPGRTTSFQYWSERLREYAQSADLENELLFWSDPVRTRIQPLPRDYPEGKNSVASLQRVTVALDADTTRSLLHEVPRIYHTEINDLLLTALSQVVTRWSGAPVLLVDLEGHGREPLFDDVDLSRTVGWFTAVYPVALEPANSDAPGAALQSVKQQLRQIPRRGIGYGALRYLNRNEQIAHTLRNLPQAEISFLYLGQFDQVHAEHAFLTLLSDADLPTRSPAGTRQHLFEISARVEQGQLHVEWRYSANLHNLHTIELLAEAYIDALNQLINHCCSVEAGDSTPADFPLAGLSTQQLSQVSHLLEQIDNVDLSD